MPCVLPTYFNGVWRQVPVAMPPGFTGMTLTQVRMTSTGEGWAIGTGAIISAEEIDLYAPVIVHLVLPGEEVPLPVIGGLTTTTASALGTSALTVTSMTLTDTGSSSDGVRVAFDVTHPAEAAVLVQDATRRVVRTIPVRMTGQRGEVEWDGRDDAGTTASPGQYTILVHAFTAREQAYAHRKFLVLPRRGKRPAVVLNGRIER